MTAAFALLAVLSLSGDPETIKVTVELEDTTLTDVLTNLTYLTEVPIEIDEAARKRLGDTEKRLSFKVKDISLSSALKILLAPHGLSFKVIDRKKVVVTVK